MFGMVSNSKYTSTATDLSSFGMMTMNILSWDVLPNRIHTKQMYIENKYQFIYENKGTNEEKKITPIYPFKWIQPLLSGDEEMISSDELKYISNKSQKYWENTSLSIHASYKEESINFKTHGDTQLWVMSIKNNKSIQDDVEEITDCDVYYVNTKKDF